MDGFCKNENVEMARSIFRDIPSKHLELNLVSYNTIIGGCIQNKLINEANHFLLKMKEEDILPDGITYNSIVQQYIKNGYYHEASTYFGEMVLKGLSPDPRTMELLLKSLETMEDNPLLEVVEKWGSAAPNTFTRILNCSMLKADTSSCRELYKNNIQGAIPTELGNLKSLIRLELYNISGKIPPSLGNLKSLVFEAFQNLLHKRDGDRSEWEYLFAVAGVNISFMLVQMLDLQSGAGGFVILFRNSLDFSVELPLSSYLRLISLLDVKQNWNPNTLAGHRFLELLSQDEMAFDNLFCVAFKMLDAQWLAKRASYMEFNVLAQEFIARTFRAGSVKLLGVPMVRASVQILHVA
ncbi:hypothetical protein DH2020_014028 [Rehmannia glutinosa]|uniref:ELMO domain-containing protein n=1 Tax=Rehmannia glutinosa TaxID=99300 RepID=A0ABR0WV69_REHGL